MLIKQRQRLQYSQWKDKIIGRKRATERGGGCSWCSGRHGHFFQKIRHGWGIKNKNALHAQNSPIQSQCWAAVLNVRDPESRTDKKGHGRTTKKRDKSSKSSDLRPDAKKDFHCCCMLLIFVPTQGVDEVVQRILSLLFGCQSSSWSWFQAFV